MNRNLALLFLLAIFLLLGSLPVAGVSTPANGVFEQALDSYTQAYGSKEEFLTQGLPGRVGDDGEWLALALAQGGEYDLSAYGESLLSYLSEEKVSSPVSRLKYALVLAALGSGDSYIATALRDATGKQGLMSIIFGLHLCNNGYKASTFTSDTLIAQLLSLQKVDGGFAVTGDVGDVDATAMTLQALAPHTASAAVSEAVAQGVTFLSEKQLPQGDFASYGVANAESTAQVCIALCALGIDCRTDDAFVKAQGSAWDGLLRYQLDDGSFCHRLGEVSGGMATVQALNAAVALERFSGGKGSLYLLDHAAPSLAAPAAPETSEDKGATGELPDEHLPPLPSWRIWVSIGVGAVFVVLLLLLACKRHLCRQNVLLLALAACLLLGAVWLVNVRTPSQTPGEKSDVKGYVTLSIRCDSVAGEDGAPGDGVILESVSLPLAEGDSVYTILHEACAGYGITLESTGRGAQVYVSGIAGIYELDHGPESGWLYSVNGICPQKSAGDLYPDVGDVILWQYSKQNGDLP